MWRKKLHGYWKYQFKDAEEDHFLYQCSDKIFSFFKRVDKIIRYTIYLFFILSK